MIFCARSQPFRQVDVACGTHHGLAVDEDGVTWQWGFGRLTPKRFEGLDGVDVKAVACGRYYAAAVTTGSEALTWVRFFLCRGRLLSWPALRKKKGKNKLM